MKNNELEDEVRGIVQARIDAEQATEAAWLTHEVIALHDAIEGEDKPFYDLCAYEHVRDVVRCVIRGYKNSEADTDIDRQLLLPGFERLQRSYIIERDKAQVIVPLRQMTRAEIIAKAIELEAMAAGCVTHARELRRFLDEAALEA